MPYIIFMILLTFAQSAIASECQVKTVADMYIVLKDGKPASEWFDLDDDGLASAVQVRDGLIKENKCSLPISLATCEMEYFEGMYLASGPGIDTGWYGNHQEAIAALSSLVQEKVCKQEIKKATVCGVREFEGHLAVFRSGKPFTPWIDKNELELATDLKNDFVRAGICR